MKHLLILSLLFFLATSCKKEHTIHITAKNAATGEPYPSLTYYFVTFTNINGGTNTKTVATGTFITYDWCSTSIMEERTIIPQQRHNTL